MRHAYFLVLPDTHLLDLAGPLQIVSTLAELGVASIDTQCIGPSCEVRAYQGAMLGAIQPLPATLPDDTVLFVIGSKLDAGLPASRMWQDAQAWQRAQAGLPASPAWQDAAAWLRLQADLQADSQADVQTSLSPGVQTGAPRLTICGVCTGAFLLGAAGLLDGRVCTTHYRSLDRLAHAFPRARVVDNRVYVRDRGVWTSAGVTAGIDMTLHLIAARFGDDVAVQVARENVAYFRHFASDPPLHAQLRYRSHANALVHAVQDKIAARLDQPPAYAALARETGYSIRHLTRLFERETGTTIKRYQMALRMELARRLLRESALPVEQIAQRCGFSSVQAFRANWDQCESVPPLALRSAAARAMDVW